MDYLLLLQTTMNVLEAKKNPKANIGKTLIDSIRVKFVERKFFWIRIFTTLAFRSEIRCLSITFRTSATPPIYFSLSFLTENWPDEKTSTNCLIHSVDKAIKA